MNIFKSITIQNFLSFGNVETTVVLDTPGITTITGANLDNSIEGSLSSNGAGKTTIINALVYCLYDKALSQISKDNLVNNINKKKLKVELVFTDDRDREIRIIRCRKMKSGPTGNTVQLFVDGVDNTQNGSQTNDRIVQILGIPHELFIQIVTFSASKIPFFDLPVRSHYAANQTGIIEKLFDIDILASKAVSLKANIKDTEELITAAKQKYDFEYRENERYYNQLKSSKRRIRQWDLDKTNKLQDIEIKLNKIKDTDIEKEITIKSDIDKLNNELVNMSSEIDILNIHNNKGLLQIVRLEEHNEKLKNKMCPYCNQEYLDTTIKFKENKKQIATIAKQIATDDVLVSQINDNIKRVRNKAKKLKQVCNIDEVNVLLDIQSNQSNLIHEQNMLIESLNPHTDTYEELKKDKPTTANKDVVEQLYLTLEHQQFLLKLLTKKDSFLRKNLLNNQLPYLNKRLMKYIRHIGLPHVVQFNNNMSASISLLGRDIEFGNLSAGQRARINIALSFAFRDVIQYKSGFVNICLLDEVLDVGLDEVGILNAAKMITEHSKKGNISMFIISHRNEIEQMDTVDNILVTLRNGFSTLEYT